MRGSGSVKIHAIAYPLLSFREVTLSSFHMLSQYHVVDLPLMKAFAMIK